MERLCGTNEVRQSRTQAQELKEFGAGQMPMMGPGASGLHAPPPREPGRQEPDRAAGGSGSSSVERFNRVVEHADEIGRLAVGVQDLAQELRQLAEDEASRELLTEREQMLHLLRRFWELFQPRDWTQLWGAVGDEKSRRAWWERFTAEECEYMARFLGVKRPDLDPPIRWPHEVDGSQQARRD